MQNLQLDKITDNGFIDLILKIKNKKCLKHDSKNEPNYLTVKIRGGNFFIRIMSDHLVRDMKTIIEFIEENDKQIREFSKEIENAAKKLKEIKRL
tara:strand:- start:1435 stop:1719 length:285 start_codon:yes stop_codon:yes gene_type:complete